MNRIIDKYPSTEEFVIEVIKIFPAITDEKEKIRITYLAYRLYEKFKYNPYRKDEENFYREFFANMRKSLNEMKKDGKIDEIYNETKLKDNSIVDLNKKKINFSYYAVFRTCFKSPFLSHSKYSSLISW